MSKPYKRGLVKTRIRDPWDKVKVRIVVRVKVLASTSCVFIFTSDGFSSTFSLIGHVGGRYLLATL